MKLMDSQDFSTTEHHSLLQDFYLQVGVIGLGSDGVRYIPFPYTIGPQFKDLTKEQIISLLEEVFNLIPRDMAAFEAKHGVTIRAKDLKFKLGVFRVNVYDTDGKLDI